MSKKVNPYLQESHQSSEQTQSNSASQVDHQALLEARPQKDHIKMGFFICFMLTVYLGGIQFGILISSWNVEYVPFALLNGLDPDISKSEESANKNLVVQCVTVVGSAFGALFSGKLVDFGRWKCLVAMNILTIGCSAMQMLYTNYALFNVARFIYGLAIGGFSVFSNQFVSEIAPKEISGPAGAIFQLTVVVGGLIPTGVGQIVIDPNDTAQQKQVLTILLLAPAAVSILQLILLFTCFRADTPVYYNKIGDIQGMRRVLAMIYQPHAVQQQVDEIQQSNSAVDDDQEEETVGYGAIFTDPKYRKATCIGLLLASFQQLTGVNIVYFDSNQIFKNTGLSAGTCTFLIQACSLVGGLIGMVQTNYFGRKTIMFWFSLAMAALLIGLGISIQSASHTYWPLVFVIGFCVCFQASIGPVTWLYMAEIMQEKGLSIGTVINWIFTLFFSWLAPTMVNYGENAVGWLFIVCGGLTIVLAIFILTFVKETKGKSLKERKALFAGNDM